MADSVSRLELELLLKKSKLKWSIVGKEFTTGGSKVVRCLLQVEVGRVGMKARYM